MQFRLAILVIVALGVLGALQTQVLAEIIRVNFQPGNIREMPAGFAKDSGDVITLDAFRKK